MYQCVYVSMGRNIVLKEAISNLGITVKIISAGVCIMIHIRQCST